MVHVMTDFMKSDCLSTGQDEIVEIIELHEKLMYLY